MNNLKILVVDDEDDIRNLLCDFLRNDKFIPIEAEDGEDALNKFNKYSNELSLIILDVMMPKKDGFEVLKEIRKVSDIPIIMLTAKVQEKDQLNGFEYGADDYIQKPFLPSVLMARIKNKLKNNISAERINEGNISINLQKRTVYINNQKIDLTPKEYSLLLFFINNRNRAISRKELLQKVWGIDNDDSRTIDTHIKQLRIKLKDSNLNIKTVRSFGYILNIKQ